MVNKNKKRMNHSAKRKTTKDFNVFGTISISVAVVALLAVIIVFLSHPGNKPTQSNTTPTSAATATSTPDPNAKITKVLIKTNRGDIELALRPDLMPKTVKNYMKLVKEKFYNGLTFHRVEDWVIQGGDPTLVGKPAPNWTIDLETNPQLTNVKYAVGMARTTDPNSANSQFYILKADSASLDGEYAIFGNVIKGQDVVDKIQIGDKMNSVEEVK